MVEWFQVTGFIAPIAIGTRAAAQPGMRKREAILGDLVEIAFADHRLEAEARNVVAQLLALVRAPVLHELPCLVERTIVVEQADPERRQRRQPLPRPAVG